MLEIIYNYNTYFRVLILKIIYIIDYYSLLQYLYAVLYTKPKEI